MFKKTKIKQIISLIHLNSSNSFIANALDVSRNSVIKIRSKIDELNLSKEDLEERKTMNYMKYSFLLNLKENHH